MSWHNPECNCTGGCSVENAKGLAESVWEVDRFREIMGSAEPATKLEKRLVAELNASRFATAVAEAAARHARQSRWGDR